MIFRILQPLTTVPPARRFRAAVALSGGLLLPLPAAAATRAFTAMISAPVAENARAEMPDKLWAELVRGWINAERTIAAGADPSVDDCRRAGAKYLVVAPFTLSPHLPGTARSSDRMSAQTHAVVTACADATIVLDRVVNLESDPLSVANPGDIEPNYDVTWNRNIRSTLGRTPIPFPTSARVARVEREFIYLDLPSREGLFVGEILRVRGNGAPVDVQITDVHGKWTQATIASPGGHVSAGDVVEAVPNGAATSPAVPSAAVRR